VIRLRVEARAGIHLIKNSSGSWWKYDIFTLFGVENVPSTKPIFLLDASKPCYAFTVPQFIYQMNISAASL
jgi:hypothetical protein